MEEGKTKCHIKLKKSDQNSGSRKRKTLDVFEGSHYSHDEENNKNEPEERAARKAQKIRGIKNGEIIAEPSNDLEKEANSATSDFIRSLQEKLERVQSKKKIVYLNFPKKVGSGLSNKQSDEEYIRGKPSDGPNELSGGSADGNNRNDDSHEKEDLAGLAKDDDLATGGELEADTDLGADDRLVDDAELTAEFHLNRNEQDKSHKYHISEKSLTYKRKLFLEKFNKNQKESIFKNEMNMYTDFDDHHIQVENYGKRILKKMGFNEEVYNKYINQYYQERSDKNYFDKIYDSFQAREFRFTGVGAEEEMRENMQRIRDGERGRNRSAGRNRSGSGSQDEEDNRERRKKRRNGEKERGDKPEDNAQRSSGKSEHGEEATCAEPSPSDKTDNLFEGLIVKINLKTHEFYKRKGVIVYTKRRRKRKTKTKDRNMKETEESSCMLGLLLFKNHKYIHLYKEMVKKKIKDYLSWKAGDYHSGDDSSVDSHENEKKKFWKIFLKELIKKVKHDRDDDGGVRNNESKEPFHLTEVKSKYVETSISEDTVKCKVVGRGIHLSKGDMSLYKQTVKLKKIKGDHAHVQVQDGHLLKLSLDDICQYINHV
ncbi:conserved Plasmodium protein, unknown function [Plasmodium knowlesi strain H]|uniref:Uncharacterized protein n=3 Tax=Plasmodium knowlesi TaxID=5850 RepID=A0A5K1VI19_PLAKH|nr:conserved Plasmodium protein, unknown function [Plasmodium knowlesi strain H]OTN67462.1 Uncharacterized protein PKNOH_S06423800 [Plasmodium knowlesi]CAA9987511.1 conserved Plasmodium protein, unknown function [Plasmodium knowlesi strain H]SBO23152.1 conserved Plasmodium protein, unknown function [Plasmodium knowlesi strain H]SBO23815.1 conserved Plasmodium protein, unknown function [Plasmodium knowlesi strain H]VVS76985.1 conserved Plasmodium protein, unknown function [Plasmodium knowlesi s|eukprot:XP_002258512.1 hypothetical protein, conserved in Plasmodium species [Plasmodium knowlesi strain H]